METLQRKISRLYFYHGQFCATYSAQIIVGVIFIVLLFCYPLTYIHLPKNAPFDYSSVLESEYKDNNATGRQQQQNSSHRLGYVVQILVRQTVSPWEAPKMRPVDALRGPLVTAFRLDRLIREYMCPKTGRSLADVCLQVGDIVNPGGASLDRHPASFFPFFTSSSTAGNGPSTGSSSDAGYLPPLPSFSCLHLSPTLFWDRSLSQFEADLKPLSSLNRPGRNTIKEIVFGLPWKLTGISRFFIRNCQRVISFSVTIFLKEYDKEFLDGLRLRLETAYPSSVDENPENEAKVNMVFYKEKSYFSDYTPLGITYVVLLLYVYFSVRKIEMVKSKWGLAFSACFTVVSSLLMSIGICVYIGLTPTLNGSEIFPYLVVLIGLENVLVITKSVVATPVDLPVKDRIAQGLSKEGWPITKNLMTELVLLTVGFFTFNPAIQEFCLFAVVGLTTDFFLQMFFFVTVLSIDIRRMELSDLESSTRALRQNRYLARSLSYSSPSDSCDPIVVQPNSSTGPSNSPEPCDDKGDYLSNGDIGNDSSWSCGLFSTPYHVSKQQNGSAMRTANVPTSSASTTDDAYIKGHKRKVSDLHTAAFIQSEGQVPVYVPLRLRFLYFWAKTRLFQRVLMVVLVCWIIVFFYTTGFYRPLLSLFIDQPSTNSNHTPGHTPLDHYVSPEYSTLQSNGRTSPNEADSTSPSLTYSSEDEAASSLGDLLSPMQDVWKVMAYYHWPGLFRFYNMTLTGHHLTVLPPLHLNHIITAEEALTLRQPDDMTSPLGSSSEYGFPDLPESLLPRSFSGYADVWLTMGMIVTCIVGASLVLSATYVAMCVFQCLQARKRRRRPLVVRIMPLVIPAWGRPSPANGGERCDWYDEGIEQMATGAGHVAAVGLTKPECVRIWRLDSGESVSMINRKSQFNHDEAFDQTTFSLPTVWCMVVSRGIVYLGCNNGTIECWDFVTSRLLSVVECDTSGITKMVLVKNSIYAVSYTGYLVELVLIDNPVSEENQSGCSRLHLHRKVKAHHHPITDFHVKETGTIVTVSEDCMIKLFDRTTLSLQTTIYSTEGALSCVHITNNTIVYGSMAGTIHLYDIEAANEIRLRHTESISWLRLTHSGCIVSCDLEGLVCLWRVGRSRPLWQHQMSPDVVLLASPVCLMGDVIVFGDKGKLTVVNTETCRVQKSIHLLRDTVAPSPCPSVSRLRRLFTASVLSLNPRTACLDARDASYFPNLLPIALTDDRQFLISMSGSNIVVIPASVIT